MKVLSTILLYSVLIFSCSKDNDDVLNTELDGNWTLEDVICYCGFGADTDFSTHQIEFESWQLLVENSGEYEFLSDASGPFTLNAKVITFRNGRQYKYEVEGDTLTLIFVDEPNIADDEVTMVYRRN